MLKSWKKRAELSLWTRLRRDTRSRLLSGVLVIVPLGLTFFVLRLLYQFTAGRLTPYIQEAIGPFPGYVVPAVSVTFLFIFLYFIGLAANVVVGRQAIALAEAVLRKIPVVKTVYGASKQVVETLSFQGQGSNFKAAVFVEFPYRGIKAVGFVTGSVRVDREHVYYKVFIPTTPNITVGLFQLCAPDEVFRCGLSVEDAVKMIVSGGIVAPDRIRLTPIAEALAESVLDSEDDEG